MVGTMVLAVRLRRRRQLRDHRRRRRRRRHLPGIVGEDHGGVELGDIVVDSEAQDVEGEHLRGLEGQHFAFVPAAMHCEIKA